MSRRDFKLEKATQVAESILRNCIGRTVPVEFKVRNPDTRHLAIRTVCSLRNLITSLSGHLGDPSKVTEYRKANATKVSDVSYANLLENTDYQLSALMVEVNLLREAVQFVMLEIINDQMKRIPDNDCLYELSQLYSEVITPNFITNQCRRSIEHAEYLVTLIHGEEALDLVPKINGE